MRVCAVNPNADEVEGDKCFHSLAEIPGGVDAVGIPIPHHHCADDPGDLGAARRLALGTARKRGNSNLTIRNSWGAFGSRQNPKRLKSVTSVRRCLPS